MLNPHADRTAVATFRRKIEEHIAEKVQVLIDRTTERDAGFIQGLQTAILVLDEIVGEHNNPQRQDH